MALYISEVKQQLGGHPPRSIRPIGGDRKFSNLRWIGDDGQSLEGFCPEGKRVVLHHYDIVEEVNEQEV